jgi:hypothetical protein
MPSSGESRLAGLKDLGFVPFLGDTDVELGGGFVHAALRVTEVGVGVLPDEAGMPWPSEWYS